MNEFLACTRRDPPIDIYYEYFIKLSRHASHLTEDQGLRRFIYGLEGIIANEVEALRPRSLANALIRAKSKLSSVRAMPGLDITYPLSRTRPIPASDIPPAWDRHRGKSLSCLEMPAQGVQSTRVTLLASRLSYPFS